MAKEEIAHYAQFLLFPQCCHKLSTVKASESVSLKERFNFQLNTLPYIYTFVFIHVFVDFENKLKT